ncbi:MAG: hypothetical protein ACR2GX_01855 [Candidatus Dormibacteria bacterium]
MQFVHSGKEQLHARDRVDLRHERDDHPTVRDEAGGYAHTAQ